MTHDEVMASKCVKYLEFIREGKPIALLYHSDEPEASETIPEEFFEWILRVYRDGETARHLLQQQQEQTGKLLLALSQAATGVIQPAPVDLPVSPHGGIQWTAITETDGASEQ